MPSSEMFPFYHADRWNRLHTGMIIEVDSSGCSEFGRAYRRVWDRSVPIEAFTDAEAREHDAEAVRRGKPEFRDSRLSRFSVFFAALTVDDALWHARNILPSPTGPISVFEVRSRNFMTLDRNWLDYSPTKNENVEAYWWGEISNHCPVYGDRRPPRLEVLVGLPVTIGQKICTV